jgi:hypothetical protein
MKRIIYFLAVCSILSPGFSASAQTSEPFMRLFTARLTNSGVTSAQGCPSELALTGPSQAVAGPKGEWAFSLYGLGELTGNSAGNVFVEKLDKDAPGYSQIFRSDSLQPFVGIFAGLLQGTVGGDTTMTSI